MNTGLWNMGSGFAAARRPGMTHQMKAKRRAGRSEALLIEVERPPEAAVFELRRHQLLGWLAHASPLRGPCVRVGGGASRKGVFPGRAGSV